MRTNVHYGKILEEVSTFVDCEQAHLFGRGAATESWREELFLALPTLFLASPILGTQTSEPARRLQTWRSDMQITAVIM